MAILGNFEVTILTPTTTVSKITGLLERHWQPLEEYSPPQSDDFSATNCNRYIGLPSPLPSPSSAEQVSTGNYTYQPQTNTYEDEALSLVATNTFQSDTNEELIEFAIDYKVHCGFSFVDPEEADLIVFRTYLDGERIGSGFVKRERWERSGSYRIRKSGKRVWVNNAWDGQWVQQRWSFDQGRHGTLKIEAWRETGNTADPGHGRLFQAPGVANGFSDSGFVRDGRVMIDLTGLCDDSSPVGSPTKTPKIRRTRRVDMWPMATFIFEYRTEKTLKSLGIIQEASDVDNDDEKFQQARREKSSETMVVLAQEHVLSPLPSLSPSPAAPQRRMSMQSYNTSPFWSSPVKHSVTQTAPTPADPELGMLLNRMEVEYEQFTSIDMNIENWATQQSELVLQPEEAAYGGYADKALSGRGTHVQHVDLDLTSQHLSEENNPPQSNSLEVVDLTMLD